MSGPASPSRGVFPALRPRRLRGTLWASAGRWTSVVLVPSRLLFPAPPMSATYRRILPAGRNQSDVNQSAHRLTHYTLFLCGRSHSINILKIAHNKVCRKTSRGASKKKLMKLQRLKFILQFCPSVQKKLARLDELRMKTRADHCVVSLQNHTPHSVA